MARANYNSTMAAAVASGRWSPALLASFTFRSEVVNMWSGPGSLTWNGLTFTGIGSLGRVSITGGEDGSVSASGATVAISGIDGVMLGEVLTDLLPNGPASLWLAAWSAGAIVGTPYALFAGFMSQANIAAGIPTPQDPDATNKFTLALQLETSMKQLNRASKRRYTASDQRIYYPDDAGFNWQALEQDIAVRWG